MNRNKEAYLRGLLITLAVFAALFAGGVLLIHSISSLSGEAETETVERAVRSTMVTCYAVEGAYPSDIEYLQRHYGLVWDDDIYIVVYDAFASNIMPDVQILEKGGYTP